jgi:predicted nucleic acid-binding protein
MNRLFFDANVLFTAAHNPHGKAALIIELGIKGHWQLLTSTYAVAETRRNLTAKFPAALTWLETFLPSIVVMSHNTDSPFPAGLAEKDCPIFQAALGCGASHLLTGDLKDFGPWMNRPEATSGIIIQTIAHFLESL